MHRKKQDYMLLIISGLEMGGICRKSARTNFLFILHRRSHCPISPFLHFHAHLCKKNISHLIIYIAHKNAGR